MELARSPNKHERHLSNILERNGAYLCTLATRQQLVFRYVREVSLPWTAYVHNGCFDRINQLLAGILG